MKTSRYMLIVVVLVGGMLMLMPGMVFAVGHGGGGHGGGFHGGGGHGGGRHGGGHSNLSFSFGFGYYGPRPYCYPYYYSSYYYPSYLYYPSYYSPRVVYIDSPEPPPVVVQRPVVVEKQTVIVQPQQFDQSTLRLNMDLQYKKSELLKQLQAPNKELRRQAIRELGGFSFDDNVKAALENILLSDPDPELRAEAADAFSAVKNGNARSALERARVEDPSADVRRAADDAIRSIAGN